MKPLEPELAAVSLTNQVRQTSALLQDATGKIEAQLPAGSRVLLVLSKRRLGVALCKAGSIPEYEYAEFPLADLDAAAVLAWCRDRASPGPGK